MNMGMLEWALDALGSRWPELLVAAVFGSFSWYWTRLRTRVRIGRRVATELVETQVALRHRADPSSGWKEQDAREEWMLEPYVRRIDFLQGLTAAEGLSIDVVEAVTRYQHRMQDFIRVWSNARRRRGEFQTAYGETMAALTDALLRLKRHGRYRSRLAELAFAPRDEGEETSG